MAFQDATGLRARSDHMPRTDNRAATRMRDLMAWWRGTGVLAGLFLLTLAVFISLAVAAHHVPYFKIDLQATRALQAHRTATLDALSEWVAWPGFPPQSNVVF